MNLIDILDEQGKVKYHFIKPVCFRAFPAYVWKKGEIIKEDYNLFIPEDIKNSPYSIRLGVFDYQSKEVKHASSSLSGVVDDAGRVCLSGI